MLTCDDQIGARCHSATEGLEAFADSVRQRGGFGCGTTIREAQTPREHARTDEVTRLGGRSKALKAKNPKGGCGMK